MSERTYECCCGVRFHRHREYLEHIRTCEKAKAIFDEEHDA